MTLTELKLTESAYGLKIRQIKRRLDHAPAIEKAEYQEKLKTMVNLKDRVTLEIMKVKNL